MFAAYVIASQHMRIIYTIKNKGAEPRQVHGAEADCISLLLVSAAVGE